MNEFEKIAIECGISDMDLIIRAKRWCKVKSPLTSVYVTFQNKTVWLFFHGRHPNAKSKQRYIPAERII